MKRFFALIACVSLLAATGVSYGRGGSAGGHSGGSQSGGSHSGGHSGGSHSGGGHSGGSHPGGHSGGSHSGGHSGHIKGSRHPGSTTHGTTHHWTGYVGARDGHGRLVRSEAAKREFMRETGYPHGRPGYVVDHIIALKRGGPDRPSNMQWQTITEAKAKDKWE